ncbi:MAG: hypothetical protein M3418_05875, partial [Gemmatimonadota bacterium]|nr:hypothetical protein [Gemmatimonadota bacterium]
MKLRANSRQRHGLRVRRDATGGENPHDFGRGTRLGARLAFGAVILLATLSPWRFEADLGQVLEELRRALSPSLSPR